MSTDLLVYLALVGSAAAWVTVHVLTAAAFFFSARKRFAAIAFFVPFAAPIVALRERERALGIAWLVTGAAYVALRLYART